MKATTRDFVKVPYAAQILDVSRSTMYKLVNDPDFYPAFRIGNRIVVSVEALERWAAEKTAVVEH